MTTRRFHRTAGAAFKDADYATAFWPPEPTPASFLSGVAYWAALILCVLAFVLLSGCTGPTDPEADADSAAALQDAVAAAVVAASARK